MTLPLRFELILWAAGMLGVAAMVFLVAPNLLAKRPAKLPLPVVLLLSLVQSGLFVGLAVWAGAALAPLVGLSAPVFLALAENGSVLAALQPQLIPGAVGGLLGAAVVVAAQTVAPVALRTYFESLTPSLPQRMLVGALYGGITEEILMRWGLMTFVVWLPWKFLQHQQGLPSDLMVYAAIAVSAIIFAAGHLPAVASVGKLTPDVVVFVLVANSVFGIVAGYLFWRFGLEAAIIAHAIAHLLAHPIVELRTKRAA